MVRRTNWRAKAGVIAAAAMLLVACTATPTLFGPASAQNGAGWSDYQIEPGRFRVTFRGGRGAPLDQVSDYALLRAADLTLQQGYDWFRVADRFVVSGGAGRGPRVSLGAGSGSYGRSSGVSLGLGTSFDLGGGASLSQTLEVVMGRGPAPRDPETYDARALRRNLGARAGSTV